MDKIDKAQLLFLLFDGTDDLVPVLNNAVDLALPVLDVFGIKKNPQYRNQNFCETTVFQYTDVEFREHFRMSRQTFQILFEKIGKINERKDDRIIPLGKKLLFSLWFLSKRESFLAATERFGLSKSTGHQIFNDMIDSICLLMGEYIRWPEDHEETIENFRVRTGGFPGIVGAVDACHIHIRQPEKSAYDYFNRKQFHSIILQGICNDEAIFIDVNIGQPGRMIDSRVFRDSPIYEQLTDAEEPLLPSDQHIVGDSAYPLSVNVLKPYRDNGNLPHAKKEFNTKLASARCVIEKAFGLLKTKFQRLKQLEVVTPETAGKIVAAACVLHNFVLMQKNETDDWNFESIAIEEENKVKVGARAEDIRGEAEDKRLSIVDLFR